MVTRFDSQNCKANMLKRTWFLPPLPTFSPSRVDLVIPLNTLRRGLQTHFAPHKSPARIARATLKRCRQTHTHMHTCSAGEIALKCLNNGKLWKIITTTITAITAKRNPPPQCVWGVARLVWDLRAVQQQPHWQRCTVGEFKQFIKY